MTSQTLLSCARLGRLYDIKRLVAAGHDLNVLIDGSTPLLAAINHNQFPVFEYLMQNGADPNLVDQDGWSGLHLAVLNSMCDHGGYPTMAYVQRLVEAGANVNAQTFQHDSQAEVKELTPLHLACMAKNLEVCAYLLDNGASVDAKDSEGRYPYDAEHCEEFCEVFQREFFQNEQEPENEDEEMSDDSEEGTLTGEDLSVAIGKIAELQADLEEERQRADALEKENEEQRILLEELKESFERELLRVQERRKKDLNKFNQFKRSVEEREDDFRHLIALLEEDRQKKAEQIHRLQTSIAHLTRSTPIASRFSAVDEDEDLSAPETPVTPPRSRREGIPSPPPSNTPKAAPRSKLQTPLNSNSLQHRGNGRGFVLCLDEENDEDVAPEVRKAPPTFRSTPTRLSRTNKDSTSRVATPREARTQAHQISDSNNPPPPSTHKLAPQPTTPLSRPQTNRSVPQTPQFVRDLMLSPRSKRRALLSTPNTLQAAHTMSSLLSLPIPLFSNLSSPTHSVDEDEDRYGDEGQEVQLAEVLEYESDSSSGVLKRKSIQPTEEGSEGHRDKRRRISYASQEPVRNEVNIPTATQSPGKRYTTVSQKGRDGLD